MYRTFLHRNNQIDLPYALNTPGTLAALLDRHMEDWLPLETNKVIFVVLILPVLLSSRADVKNWRQTKNFDVVQLNIKRHKACVVERSEENRPCHPFSTLTVRHSLYHEDTMHCILIIHYVCMAICLDGNGN